MVPLAMLSPPKFAYLSWRSCAVLNAGRQNPPRRTPRKKLPRAAIFGNLGENRAGSQQTGQESPVHIWSEGQSQVRVLLFGILARYTIPGKAIWRGKVVATGRDPLARRRKPCADSSVKTG